MDLSKQREQQDRLFEALSRSLGKSDAKFETHASVVFLIGDRAVKIKRAVSFPFLDYSTLERRKAACEAEFAINRKLAPSLYLGVVPVTDEGSGRYAIDGTGQIVDWAVQMRRFDETKTLDHVVERGELSRAMAIKLADTVLISHRAAPVAAAKPWLQAFADYIGQNDKAFALRSDLFPQDAARRLTAKSEDIFAKHRRLICARGAIGLIRRMHGDLHLGNIVLLNDEPVLFDAIEFDPLVATGDVLYDLAFLLMDLTERGLRDTANAVFNRYLQQAGEDSHFDALALLPLFMSMRAAIRAKVTAARLDTARPADRPDIEASARRYFKFAVEILNDVSARLVAVGGLSGTGKSALARDLAKHFDPAPGAVVLRSDVERKLMFGVAESERLPPIAYTRDVGRRVYQTLVSKAERILAAGYTVVVDAVFADAAERDSIASCAPSNRFHGLFLVADTDTRVARVSRREADASDADRDIALRQDSFDLGEIKWIKVDANGTAAQTYRSALGELDLAVLSEEKAGSVRRQD